MGECCCGSATPIEVYVELAGKQDYHVSLKGRDETDQHPISAITNLQENLDDIQDTINELETQISERTGTALRYKGQVTDFASLPIVDNKIGDVYNTVDTGANYLWTGNSWDNLSPVITLEDYVTKDYFEGSLDASIKLLQDHLKVHYYEKAEVEDLINDSVSIIDSSLQELSNRIDATNELLNTNIESLDNKIDNSLELMQTKLEEGDNALQDQINEFSGALVYKGIVANKEALPTTANIGHTYSLEDTNDIYFWNGTSWQILEQDILDKVYSKDEIDNLLISKANTSSVEEIQDQVGALGTTMKKLEEETKEVKTWFDLDDVINS